MTRAVKISGSFWHRLKDTLAGRGQVVTQEAVAEAFGVKQPTISGVWAQDGRGPEVPLGAKVAATYNINMHYLYTGQGAVTVPPKDTETERLLQAWLAVKDTPLGAKLLGYAEGLANTVIHDEEEQSGGHGDTPADLPFRSKRVKRN